MLHQAERSEGMQAVPQGEGDAVIGGVGSFSTFGTPLLPLTSGRFFCMLLSRRGDWQMACSRFSR